MVLITGGSSGIGRATALRLASHGARVAVASRTAGDLDLLADEITRRGSEALAVPTDVTDPDQSRRAVEATAARLGGLDVLVCCAGVSMRGPFEGSDLAAFEYVVAEA